MLVQAEGREGCPEPHQPPYEICSPLTDEETGLREAPSQGHLAKLGWSRHLCPFVPPWAAGNQEGDEKAGPTEVNSS